MFWRCLTRATTNFFTSPESGQNRALGPNMLPTNSMLEAHGRGMAAPTRAATAPGSSGATNRGPSLFSEAECKAWRERIKQETMTSGRLRIMLQDKEKARIKRVTEPYSFKHFPMPPTQYAVMMKRLNTPGAKPRSQIINFFCSSHPCTCVRRGAPRIGTQHEVATRRLAARPRTQRHRLRHDTDVGPSIAKRPPDAVAAEWRLLKARPHLSPLRVENDYR